MAYSLSSLRDWRLKNEVQKAANDKIQKEQEQSEAQPDGAWGATKQIGTNGVFREPFHLQFDRGYGR